MVGTLAVGNTPLVELRPMSPRTGVRILSRLFRADAPTSLLRMRDVAQREGLIVGVSSGATLHGAMRVAETLEEGNTVCMFSDGGWKYLPTRPWGAAETGDEALDDVHWW